MKIFTIILAILAVVWLALGIWGIFSSEIGSALFVEIFLPGLGGAIALWIVVYALVNKSFKFLWVSGLTLAIIWVGLWFLLD